MSSQYFNVCPFGEYRIIHDYGSFVEYEGCYNKLFNSTVLSNFYNTFITAFRSDPWLYGILIGFIIIGLIGIIIGICKKD